MNKEIDDGGPAFPSVASVNFDGNLTRISAEDAYIETTGGMTKREEFAKAALQGLLASPALSGAISEGVGARMMADWASTAVAQADALIAELNKP